MKKLIYDSEPGYQYFDETKKFLMEERPEDGEPSDEVVYDYMYEEKEYEWEDLEKSYLKNIFTKETEHSKINKPFVVQASIDKWNGTFDGGKILYGYEDFKYQILARYDRFIIYDNDGVLEVEGQHHDGVDNFSIRLINDKGRKYLAKKYEPHYELETRECVEDMARPCWSEKPNLYKLMQEK